MQRKIYSLLHDLSPYKGHPAESYTDDVRGWWSNDKIFEQIITTQSPALIIEIGTWKGASALHMANVCKQFKISAEIVCVDPITGGAGTWLYDRGALKQKMGVAPCTNYFSRMSFGMGMPILLCHFLPIFGRRGFI